MLSKQPRRHRRDTITHTLQQHPDEIESGIEKLASLAQQMA
jgi:hypothetical protein